MFRYKKNSLSKKAVKFFLYKQTLPLNFVDFLTFLQGNEQFRSFFIELIESISFRAYHWEVPSVTVDNLEQPFEFTVTRMPGIDLPPDPAPFSQYFCPTYSENDTSVFSNLGGDATLIAPHPVNRQLNYSHIGVFTAEAPKHQQHNLWQTVGKATVTRISDRTLWLNTAGGGVSWLHIRLDTRPKYYAHQPYVHDD